MTPRHPPEFPPLWANAWGDDRFGLWAEFQVQGVVQRMRWIEPGEFLMGAPDKESGRWDDEVPRHRVRLTRGFWLADSACTQALWSAVMGGDNPSRFTGNWRCPVEQVSWDDVQDFLQRLQAQLLTPCEPALPSEAQWEYACRASTVTPFNLGDNISPDQVNYHGHHPYDGTKRGQYRGRTVPVKSLSPNDWGLYEMHGNVWEWCADGMRDYDALPIGEALLDPMGPTESALRTRTLRGGSWFTVAWRVRSAARITYTCGIPHHDAGFRLSMRSKSPARPEGA